MSPNANINNLSKYVDRPYLQWFHGALNDWNHPLKRKADKEVRPKDQINSVKGICPDTRILALALSYLDSDWLFYLLEIYVN